MTDGIEDPVVRDLKQVAGALVFGAGRPLSVREIKGCLEAVAATAGEGATGPAVTFAEAKESDIRRALEELSSDLARVCPGFHLAEVAGGYRLQSDPGCGTWLKQLLDIGKPQRLSRPALETLAIIAYRQPISRADIEAIRGVNVDHVLKLLMEVHLVKIAGRSELPGRPFLFGTTQNFLEHFGLKGLKDLAEAEPMLARPQAPRFAKRASVQAELHLADEPGGEEGESGGAGGAVEDGAAAAAESDGDEEPADVEEPGEGVDGKAE